MIFLARVVTVNVFAQQRLYEQLSDNLTIPTEASNTIEQQKGALVKAAVNQIVLIVLDDMWDQQVYASSDTLNPHVLPLRSQHQQHFDAIDASTPSKLLVTTRY